MTGVRDPAFWRRFSMAVHQDEEKATSVTRTNSSGTESSQGSLKHSDTWLDRHRRKQKRAFWCGWLIVLFTILVLAGVAAVCLWLFKIGPFANL